MPESNIIRVFPRKNKWTPTDDLAFVGEPPLFNLPDLPVHVSVVFTWDRERGIELGRAWQKRVRGRTWIGGPGMAGGLAPLEFVPGRYIQKGVTFTSRGCPKKCPWCLVSRQEGPLRELWPVAPGHIVQDNNLLACSRPHVERVFEMVRQQKESITFSGGLDVDYLEPWHVERLKTIKVSELWVACDCEKDLKRLDKAADLLADFSMEKKRCYVLVGFGGEKLIDAERRLEAVYAKGFLPFCQPYKPVDAEFGWCPGEDRETILRVVRKWSRPGLCRAVK